MNVLAVVHGANVRPGVFGDEVVERGHRLEEWTPAVTALPRPLEDYGAVILFGGSMHADQEEQNPWLHDENALIQDLLERRVPLFGVCLGAQLIAKAAGAPVHPAPQPEIGWIPVELSGAAEDDPVFNKLPEHFDAFEWHFYTYGVPGEGSELARSAACTQAFRLGDAAWGIQFHAEVTMAHVHSWAANMEVPVPEGLLAESERRMDEWNELGRRLCGAFCAVAERAAVDV